MCVPHRLDVVVSAFPNVEYRSQSFLEIVFNLKKLRWQYFSSILGRWLAPGAKSVAQPEEAVKTIIEQPRK